MKTLSILAITAFAFVTLANFASAQRLQVSSTTFKDGGLLPLRVIDDDPEYTGGTLGNRCAPNPTDRGGKQSPALSWTNLPSGRNSFGVTASDATAQFFHGGMKDIPRPPPILPKNGGEAKTTFGLQVNN